MNSFSPRTTRNWNDLLDSLISCSEWTDNNVSKFISFESLGLISPCHTPGFMFMKIISCSTHLSIKSKMLINIEIAKTVGNFRFKSQRQSFSMPKNVKMPTVDI